MENLRDKIRKLCLESTKRLDLSTFEAIDEKDTGMIPSSDFLHVLEDYGISLNKDEVHMLFSKFQRPCGKISYRVFITFIAVLPPSDYIDPDRVQVTLPQPYRMICKVMESCIIDNAWENCIVKTEKYRRSVKDQSSKPGLHQPDDEADVVEQEIGFAEADAKRRVISPSSELPLETSSNVVHCAASYCASRQVLISDKSEIFYVDLLQSQILETFTECPMENIHAISSQVVGSASGTGMPMRFAVGGVESKDGDDDAPYRILIYDLLSDVKTDDENASTCFSLVASIESLGTFQEKGSIYSIILSPEDAQFVAVTFEKGSGFVYKLPKLKSGTDSSESTPPQETIKIECPLFIVESNYDDSDSAETAAAAVPSKGKAKSKDVPETTAFVHQERASSKPSKLHFLFVTERCVVKKEGAETKKIVVCREDSRDLYLYALATRENTDDSEISVGKKSAWVLSDSISSVYQECSSRMLAIGLTDGSIYLFDMVHQTQTTALCRHKAPITSVQIYQNQYVVSCSTDNRVHFHKLQKNSTEGSVIRVVKSFEGPVRNMQCFADVPLCAITSSSGEIMIYDLRSGQIVGKISSEVGDASLIRVSSDQLSLIEKRENESIVSVYRSAKTITTCFPDIAEKVRIYVEDNEALEPNKELLAKQYCIAHEMEDESDSVSELTKAESIMSLQQSSSIITVSTTSASVTNSASKALSTVPLPENNRDSELAERILPVVEPLENSTLVQNPVERAVRYQNNVISEDCVSRKNYFASRQKAMLKALNQQQRF